MERELNVKISQAQKASQDLNMSADKLESQNKWLSKCVSCEIVMRGDPLTPYHRNSKDKIASRIRDINELIEDKEAEVQEQALKLEEIRAKLGDIDREISEAAVTLANLRENIRFRRLKRDLAATEAELDAIDMEEAAKAKRIWTEKWNVEKQKETDLQTKVRSMCPPVERIAITDPIWLDSTHISVES